MKGWTLWGSQSFCLENNFTVRLWPFLALLDDVGEYYSDFNTRQTTAEETMFLSSYRNTPKSLVKLDKVMEALGAARVPTAFPVFPNFRSCFYNSVETRHMFSIPKYQSV